MTDQIIITSNTEVPAEWVEEPAPPAPTAKEIAKELAIYRKAVADIQATIELQQSQLEATDLWKLIQGNKTAVTALKKDVAKFEEILRELTVNESKATEYQVKKFDWGEVKHFEGKDIAEITDMPAALQWAVVNAPSQVSLAPSFNEIVVGLELPFIKKVHSDDEYKLSIKKDLSALLKDK